MTIEYFKEPRMLYCHTDLVMNDDKSVEATKGRVYTFCKESGTTLSFFNNSGNKHFFKIDGLSNYFSFEAPKEQETQTPESDNGKIEVLDFILDQELDFSSGLAIKHICKASQKPEHEQIEHLQKAVKHLKTKINYLSQK